MARIPRGSSGIKTGGGPGRERLSQGVDLCSATLSLAAVLVDHLHRAGRHVKAHV
jgi:hypothetical protein